MTATVDAAIGASAHRVIAVGRSIAASCAARRIPVQAEMDGKNASVVLADADLKLAAEQVLLGAFRSTGQKCTATSRLIVERAVADDLVSWRRWCWSCRRARSTSGVTSCSARSSVCCGRRLRRRVRAG
ncbi:aldehyde dehydrogenase family protein [Pseudonocardia bannensis]|uniref:aldehyde dehydrogenase family protein n=1 Tax=Pseudonocardia bannensis TaxID=630973 RepID=UPI0028ABDC8D|nr:aldehyde dehydrogenase family protein [Pseudonocardia bannensis]